MKKNQAQKFIVLFLFFLFAYSWRVEAPVSYTHLDAADE